MKNKHFFNLSIEDTAELLHTDLNQGLSDNVSKKRLNQYGRNELQQRKKISPLKIFIQQFTDFMVVILILATVISGLLGEYADAVTILAIIALNAILGFIQEFKAEKSIDALKKLTAPEATVLRNGRTKKVKASELVPGDLIILESGDKIPADARLIEAINMEVEEAILTGESHPIKKEIAAINEQEINIGDQKNMLFSGTIVTRGRGKGIVTATGMGTEVGKIAGMIENVEDSATPLQLKLDQLGKILVFFCLAICTLVVVTGIMRGEQVYQMFLAGVSLAVAAIPEGLPAIVTVALAIGVQKMIKRKAIIRKLPAVETLGCATFICSDKTGTLTENAMTVRKIYCDHQLLDVVGEGYSPKGKILKANQEIKKEDSHALDLLLRNAALCNNAKLIQNKNSWEINGDPTEGALLVLAGKADLKKNTLENKHNRIEEIPFDSDRKRMSVLNKNSPKENMVYTKGAPDIVLNLCSHIMLNGRIEELDQEQINDILKVNERLASDALRVLAFAYKVVDSNKEKIEELEKDLVFLGLVGIIDPPRPSAVKAVSQCKRAGIKVAMITGDHQITAQAVAKELGLEVNEQQIVTGKQLDVWNDEELQNRVRDISVYARVSPNHKLRIVQALKKNNHIVAMTGDGVNDAPAIKEADIGIAMGKSGTDVTKEASSMILADDNFSTIVAAIEEGRSIYDNIRKFIRYLLSCNVGEVLTMFLAALCGLPLPLLPIQILWVNLVTDGLPAMALGVEKGDPDLMERRPRHPKESIFSRGLWKKIIYRGIYIGVGSLLVFYISNYLSGGNLVLARTMAFATLVFSQLFHVLDCKSERYSVFEIGIFSNMYLVFALICSITMQLAVIYHPYLQTIFKTQGLNLYNWLLVLLVAGLNTYIQALKYFFIRPIKGRKLV